MKHLRHCDHAAAVTAVMLDLIPNATSFVANVLIDCRQGNAMMGGNHGNSFIRVDRILVEQSKRMPSASFRNLLDYCNFGVVRYSQIRA